MKALSTYSGKILSCGWQSPSLTTIPRGIAVRSPPTTLAVVEERHYKVDDIEYSCCASPSHRMASCVVPSGFLVGGCCFLRDNPQDSFPLRCTTQHNADRMIFSNVVRKDCKLSNPLMTSEATRVVAMFHLPCIGGMPCGGYLGGRTYWLGDDQWIKERSKLTSSLIFG